ncbi:MAG: RiPP maturation radical SAM C-methyltransferase [Planctomycetaceae bacterium]|nr:RiPP maturation radical SAM C-methyltransferase [Planctomycetaceae bacterium]
MPFANAKCPSLALGILHALLQQNRIPVRSAYGNLHFLEQYSEKVGGLSRLIQYLFLFGETLCHHAFFPEKPTIQNVAFKLSLTYKESPDLQKAFEQVQVYADEFITEYASEIVAISPAVVGCTSLLLQHLPAVLLLKKIKEANPNIITLIGGAGLDSEMGIANHRQFSWLDYVVSGDGDAVIVPLCRELIEHGFLRNDNIPNGVLTPQHRQIGYPTITPRAFFEDLDSLPFPNYDDYFDTLRHSSVLSRSIRPSLIYESSRGCAWGQTGGCHFCGLSGKTHRYRVKKPEKVLADFEAMTKKYGIKSFEMTDNMMPPEYEKSLLPKLIEKGSPYELFYEIRPNTKKTFFQTMRQAGVMGLQPGIESFSTPLLKLMNKGIVSWQAVQCLKWCRQYGFWTSWHLMWNFPEEKPEWYQSMTDLVPHLMHLQPPGGLNKMNYCRFSPFFQKYKELIPLEPDADIRLAYDFDDFDTDLSYRFNRANDFPSGIWQLALSEIHVGELSQFIIYWQNVFKKGILPELFGTKQENGHDTGVLRICDTRPAVVKIAAGNIVLVRMQKSQKEYLLNETEAAMLYFCDDAPLETVFEEHWGEQGKRFLKQYETAHIIEKLDGRLVSLVLCDPVSPIPPAKDLPFGTVS